MKKHFINWNLFVVVLTTSLSVFSQLIAQQTYSNEVKRVIEFPDIPNYKTIICDFHQHSVFSDGDVWPSIRVQEAIKDGIDAISITEHLEYQPHSNDIPHPDRNRAYYITLKEAEDQDIVVVNGAEVTRSMPPGHVNAIFLKDANRLLLDDPIDVLREAKRQGAFIFWDHPNWVVQNRNGIAKLTDMHRQLIKEGLLNGIEVVNNVTFSDEAFQIAIDNNLAIIGSSDIHGLVDWQFNISEGGHRPVTLVFAKEKSEESIKEALFNRRTAVWFNNTLIGDSLYLIPLIQQSLSLIKTEVIQSYKGDSFVLSVYIKNQSGVDYILENQSGFTLHSHADIVTIGAHDTVLIQVKTLELLPAFDLHFKVLNAIIAPNKHPEIVLKIKG